MTDKIDVTELNEIRLKSMPNSFSDQAYAQGGAPPKNPEKVFLKANYQFSQFLVKFPKSS